MSSITRKSWQGGSRINRICSALIAIVFVAAAAASLSALERPAKNQLLRYAQDGSLEIRIQTSLALGNHLVSPRLVRDYVSRISEMGLKPPVPSDLTPSLQNDARRNEPKLLKSIGSVKALALLISFPDYPPAEKPESIASKLFGDGDGNWPYESLRNYYRRSSYNALNIEGDILGWYTPPYARNGMPKTPEARENLIKDALLFYRSQGYDFSQYDKDGDGAVDYLMVIWTGPDEGWGGFFWEYLTGFSDASFSLNGTTLDQTPYAWLQATRSDTPTFDPKAAIHETGHALGLPDYYDYADSIGPGGGLGGLDMMDGERGDHNPFSKMLLGWVTPQVFDLGKAEFSLRASGNSPDVLLVRLNASSTAALNEFYLVQNRFRVENDFDLPGDGLLIWHIDARMTGNRYFLNNNSSTDRNLLSLIESDKNNNIRKRSLADPGDYLASGTSIHLDFDPSFSEADASLSVYGIGPSGPAQYFTAAWQNNASAQKSSMISAVGGGDLNSKISPRLQALNTSSTYYLDASNGSDTNNGLSPGTAWKTISKVNSFKFNPGDSILFQRGQTWQEQLIVPSSGSPGNPILFGAYGTGVKPNITGSGTRDYCMTETTGNGYITVDGIKFDAPKKTAIQHLYWASGNEGNTPNWTVQNCEFINCGIELYGPNTLVQDNTFTGVGTKTGGDGAICIRGLVATNCRVLRNRVDTFHSRGIWFLGGADNPTANDNIIHDISFSLGSSGEGYGINFDGYGRKITGTATAIGNTIYNTAQVGIFLENCSVASKIHSNLIHDTTSFGVWYKNYSASGQNTDQRGNVVSGVADYNIIYNVNCGFYLEAVKGIDIWNNVVAKGAGLGAITVTGSGSAYIGDFDVRNNIFGTGFTYIGYLPDDWTNSFSAFDYNRVPTGTVIYERGTSATRDLANLQGGGAALHCFTGDPLFVSTVTPDFHLQATSPCLNTGANLGLTKDYAGNSVPAWAGKNPDIGAYENQSPSNIPTVTSLTSSPAWPLGVGTPITWTATATGGITPLQYKFYLYSSASNSWTIARDYNAANSWTWTPTQAGRYAVQVWVRNMGSTANYDAWKGSGNFDITGSAISMTALSPSPALPQAVGTTITWTATATGGIPSLQYKYWLYNPATGWAMVRDFNTSNIWTWTPTQPGQYAVQVWVRNAGSTADYDAWKGSGYFDITGSALSVTSLTSSPGLPRSAGTTITWSAIATGGIAPLQYRYYLYSAATGTWIIAQDYSTASTWTWTPTQAGQYAIQVWVRNAGSTANYDAWKGSGYFDIN